MLNIYSGVKGHSKRTFAFFMNFEVPPLSYRSASKTYFCLLQVNLLFSGKSSNKFVEGVNIKLDLSSKY